MPIYKYRAKINPQELTEGTIEAPHEKAALKRIEEMGYFPIKVEELAPTRSRTVREQPHRRFLRIPTKGLIIFSRQLATLMRAGIPILKALAILSEQAESPALGSIIRRIHDDLKGGVSFSKALAKYPKLFSPFYIAMAQAGEDSGKLDEILIRLAVYRAKQQEIVSRVRLALVYPALMTLVGTGTIIFMFTFVMPRLMTIFIGMGERLPLPTKILMNLTGFLSHWGWLMAIGALAGVWLIRIELRRPEGKRFLSIVALRAPLVGNLLLKKEIALLSRTLELLIKSGIPILRAIELTVPVVGNELIREKLLAGHAELKQGSSLGKTLHKFKVFPVFMTNLITVGEESGKLDIPLTELADSYEQETEDSVKAFTGLLEPLLIVGMGLVIGFIVAAMLLPIFEINLMVG